jgi:putative transposase
VKMDTFIEAEKVAGRSIARCFRLFEVSRAAYYQRRSATPSAKQAADAQLSATITQIHDESRGTYGAPRIQRALPERGEEAGMRRVRRLMRAAGIAGKTRRRWRKTTVVDPQAERAKDLVQRDFAPSADVDRRYVGDITYIPLAVGFCYLATVIDLASRRVVGWALDTHLRTELVVEALAQAFGSRRPPGGVVFHSDRGCQYTSKDFGAFARQLGVLLSIGRKGECWDNAVAESFFETIKRELLDTVRWHDADQVRAAVFDYIEGWYNTRRLHSSLGYVSPATYEARIQHNADRQAA